MNVEKGWVMLRETELKRQRRFDRLIGASVGVVLFGVLVFATGCLECFGEGAIWEIRPYHDWRLWLVP